MEREKLSSRLGFILLAAGCAIGIGNVWKFPYIAGLYGGGIFLVFYLLFLLLMGIPVLAMEFSLGRASQKSIVHLYQKLEPKGTRWHWHAPFALAGNYLLMMFYTVVSGWMLRYFVEMLMGSFNNVSSQAIEIHFDEMLMQPLALYAFTAFVIVTAFFVCGAGLQNGLEKITKYMMLSLMVIMLVLAVRSLFLPGGMQGFKYLFIPDLAQAQKAGWINVITAAMNQAFFTLSIGMGSMAVFGSYIDRSRSLLSESFTVALLDTLVAITAGLIVLPACFAYNVELTAGPPLIFITLPNIFANMPSGWIWGALFFLFLTFAAYSTVLAVFENIISCTMDLTGWSRKKACLLNGLLMLVLCIPCVIGFNILKDFMPLGAGSSILDLEDYLVSNILLPLGSLVIVLFCTWDFGWGWNNFKKEANTGRGLQIPDWLHAYCKYVLPLIIAAIFAAGLL